MVNDCQVYIMPRAQRVSAMRRSPVFLPPIHSFRRVGFNQHIPLAQFPFHMAMFFVCYHECSVQPSNQLINTALRLTNFLQDNKNGSIGGVCRLPHLPAPFGRSAGQFQPASAGQPPLETLASPPVSIFHQTSPRHVLKSPYFCCSISRSPWQRALVITRLVYQEETILAMRRRYNILWDVPGA